MKEFDFLVIGAGIGGTSCAHWLSRDHKVAVLEMESQPGYHTTGRSIAVYTEAYGPKTIRALAISGYRFFTEPEAEFSNVPLSRPQGLFFIAREDQLGSLEAALEAARELSPDIHMITGEAAVERLPVLRPDYISAAFLDPTALALDVAAIHQGYMRGLKRNGGEIIVDAQAQTIERRGDKWHVETPTGSFSAPVVINAAGAWADEVGQRMGAAAIGLQPLRRTAIAFVPPGVELSDDWPVVIDTDEDWYFKVDASTVLGSLADETPTPPQDAQPEELDIALTIDRIERGTIMKVERLQRSWAGLRSFVADRVPVVGYDPEIEGLFWCAAQGGYGIETSCGMGRVSAALAAGDKIPDDISALGVTEDALSPARIPGLDGLDLAAAH